MITPEYVDHLLGLVKEKGLPIAPVTLKATRIDYQTIRYAWIVSSCPCCGGEHIHQAGYSRDEAHKHLHTYACRNHYDKCYVTMRDYDVEREAAKIGGMGEVTGDQ